MIYHQPIGVNFWVGSATTYQDKNPSFQVVTVDAKTMVPLEMETYYLDITKANKKNKPVWESHHKYTEFFGLDDLSPNSIMDYAERVYTDVEVAKHYRD
jgi:sphingomyelin phosphodiesterase